MNSQSSSGTPSAPRKGGPLPSGLSCAAGILRRLVFVFCFLCLLATSADAAAKKRILVLNSYHKGLSWTDNVVKGVEAVFPPGSSDVELDYEYMDTKRYYDEGYFGRLYEAYKYKYRKERFDVILVSDNDAFNFLKEHHRDLFAGTPVVFCGINNFQDSMLDGLSLFTGVVEETDMTGTLEAVLSLTPGVKKIVVLNDRTTTGLAVNEELLKIAPQFRDLVEFTFLDDFDVKELSDKIKALTPGSVIFLLLVNRDRTGNFFAYEESLALIHREAPVPIYSVWDFYLGGGIVGGMLTSGFEQGRTAAEMAKRILNGEDVSRLPVIRRSPNRYMFDYRELRRFGITLSRLPAGSIVINQPDTFYARHKAFIWSYVGAVAFLTSIIIFLLINISTRRRAAKALRESEEKYRDLYDNAPDMYYTIDKNGRITECNETGARMLGYAREEIVGREIKSFLGSESIPEFESNFPQFVKEGSTMTNLERVFIRKDGSSFSAILNAYAEGDRKGQLVRVKAIARDITEIKATEEQLRKSEELLRNLSAHLQSVREEERTQIAREIHDELGQALTALKLDIAWLKNKIAADHPELSAKTRTMTDLIDMTVRSVQKISSELRPGVLDHLGLPEAIQWEAGEFRERTGIECDVALDESISFDRECSLAIFRILQETLTNVSRHAGATRVEITLRASGDTLELEVGDNGRGITAEEIESPSAFGLIGIRERALFLGGNATMSGERGKGTTVTVRVPLRCHAKAR